MRLSMNKTSLSKMTKIRHRNEINKTLAGLALSAKKVLFLAMSKIDPKEKLNDGVSFVLTTDEYIAATKSKRDAAYKALQEGVKVLSATKIILNKNEIIDLSGELGLKYNVKNSPDSLDLNLTEMCAYYYTEGMIEIKFTKTASTYLSQLVGKEKRYTTQVLMSSVSLSSVNSCNLYQLIRKKISSNKYCNSFEVSLNELKDELSLYECIDNERVYKYPKFSHFKRDVLDKSIKEITKKTEIKEITYTSVLKGKKTDIVKFSFNIPSDLHLLSDEKNNFLDDFDKNCM